MVGISDIRRWDAAKLEEARSQYQRALHVLTSEGDDYAGLKLAEGDWNGEAATRAMAAHDKLVREGDRHAAGLAAIVKGLEQAADAVHPLPNQIHEAEELARKHGYTVGENGEITDTFAGKPLPKDLHPEDRARAQQEVQAKLEQVVRTATDIDTDLANVYTKAGNGEYGAGQTGNLTTAAAAGTAATALTTPDPPAHGTPTQNAAWWASLSGNEKDTIVDNTPDKVGNLNGVSAEARNKANRNRIAGMRARLYQQLKNADDLDEATNIAAKIDSLDKVDETLKNRDDRHLLYLNDSNPRLEAAVSVGNIDKAKNVSVFTPGFTTTVNDSLEGYDASMADMVNTQNNINRMNGGGSNAAVTWIGYQAPQTNEMFDGKQSTITPEAARVGGDKLAGFLNGVGASHEANKPMHLTALGHSYGSTTTGYALSHNTPVNDAVLFGSPGEGWGGKPHVDGGHIYSEQAAHDPVPAAGKAEHALGADKDAGPLGPDTYSDPNVHHLSTNEAKDQFGKPAVDDEGKPYGSAFGHSQYLQDGTASQYNMAAVASGNPEAATAETPDDVGLREAANYVPPSVPNPDFTKMR